jgi:hypothetical protein
MNNPNPPLTKIHADIIALRKQVGGLKSEDKPGVRFKVKSAAGLMAKLRAGLDNLNMVCYPVEHEVTQHAPIETDKGVISSCTTKIVLYIGSDDGSYLLVKGIGRGADTADKAEGKASTYAWKDALIKGLCLPDADMPDTDDEDLTDTIARAVKAKATKGKPAGNLAPLLAKLEGVTDLVGLAAIQAEARAADLSQNDAVAFIAAYNERKEGFNV